MRLKDYRIYGRKPREKRFKAMDMNRGIQVNNLIRATVYWAVTESKLERLQALCKQLEEDNPGWVFELRERKNERAGI